MNTIKTALMAVAIVTAMVLGAGAPAWSQSAEWNSLFERIVRLEHEVRAMKGSGGGAGGGDAGYRLSSIEEQLRNLAGQLSAMSRQMQKMQGQIEELKRQRSGSLKRQQKTQTAQQITQPDPSADLYSSGDDLDLTVLPEASEPLQSEFVPDVSAPGSYGDITGQQVLGQLVINDDGTFTAQPSPEDDPNSLLPGSVETASLGDVDGGAGGAGPDALFQRSYDNLLKRRFGLAEAGFRTFLAQNKRHRKAGQAQYWLGESYYAQGRYKQAAQSFLSGYKGYPKGSKAPDSLLKLGMSLGKLGQRKQACGAYAEVQRAYPKAAARKLAAREAQRGGC